MFSNSRTITNKVKEDFIAIPPLHMVTKHRHEKSQNERQIAPTYLAARFGGMYTGAAQPIRFGHPEGVDPKKFHLVTPYDSDPGTWLVKEWIDQHSKKRFRITTQGHWGSRQAARVKTYGDVVTEYEFHPEAKCAGAFGKPCDRQTTGLLQRRHIKIDQIKCIGKESNSLESVDEGMIHSAQNVYTEYADPKRSEWITKIQPALKKAPLIVLVKECGKRLSRRELIELRAGRSRPHRKTKDFLVSILRGLGLL